MTNHNECTPQVKLFPFYPWNKDRPRSFENFLLTDENTEAFRAAQRAALQPGEVSNPLYIYGGTCTGKTYLLYAIEDFLTKNSPAMKAVHVTAEEFLNELSDAIREREGASKEKFRLKYRSADVLLLDDVQYLIGKDKAMEEFLLTFNALYDAGKQIVVTGNHDPEALKQEGMEERVAARLLIGRSVEIRRKQEISDASEAAGAVSEASGKLPDSANNMSCNDEGEDYLTGWARQFVFEYFGEEGLSYIQKNLRRKKFQIHQVNYRQACRTFMEHPDVIVKLFYRGLSKELVLLFCEGTVEDIQEMRHGKLFFEGDDFINGICGAFLDGHNHYCNAYVKSSRVYFLYDSRAGIAAMYRAKTSPESGRTWLYYGKYTPEDGKVSFVSIAESPKKEKDIRNFLLGRFREEEIRLRKMREAEEPEGTAGKKEKEDAAECGEKPEQQFKSGPELKFHLISKYWDQILDRVRTGYEISDIAWHLWIRPMKPYELRKRDLYIACSSEMEKSMADRKFSSMIRDAVEQVTGIGIDPVFLSPDMLEFDSVKMKEYIKKLKEVIPEKAARYLLSDMALRYY